MVVLPMMSGWCVVQGAYAAAQCQVDVLYKGLVQQLSAVTKAATVYAQLTPAMCAAGPSLDHQPY